MQRHQAFKYELMPNQGESKLTYKMSKWSKITPIGINFAHSAV